MGRDIGAVELAAGERGVDVLILAEIDDLDLAQPALREEALLVGDIPLAVAEPGLECRV